MAFASQTGRIFLRSEERTYVRTERIANRDGEQCRNEHEAEAHHRPETPLEEQGVVLVLKSTPLVHDFLCLSWVEILALRRQKSAD